MQGLDGEQLGEGAVSGEEMCPGAHQTADAHQGRRWTPGTAPGWSLKDFGLEEPRQGRVVDIAQEVF